MFIWARKSSSNCQKDVYPFYYRVRCISTTPETHTHDQTTAKYYRTDNAIVDPANSADCNSCPCWESDSPNFKVFDGVTVTDTPTECVLNYIELRNAGGTLFSHSGIKLKLVHKGTLG